MTKEYSNLPPFDGTEPTSPRQANGDGGISNEMIPINDLSKLFCLTNALQLSRDDGNPFHPYGSMEETIKALISTATDDMGPTSRDQHDSLLNLRDVDADLRDADVKRRVRMRALLRVHLAITRQNEIKSSLAAHSTADSPTSSTHGDSAATVNATVATAVVPSSIFTSNKHRFTDDTSESLLRDLVVASGLSMGISTVQGLKHSPFYDPVIRSVFSSLVQTLGMFLPPLAPLPRTCSRSRGRLSEGPLEREEGPVFPPCQVVSRWDRTKSCSNLVFSDGDTSAMRPGSASSYPGAQ